MDKLEKVIRGLECCTQPGSDCAADCPYTNARHVWMTCADVLMTDALALLKAQEPRVMGVGDLYGADMGFYERKGEELVCPVLIARGGPDDDGTVGIVRKDAFEIKADCGLINQTWRIWTARPTAAERGATPWN